MSERDDRKKLAKRVADLEVLVVAMCDEKRGYAARMEEARVRDRVEGGDRYERVAIANEKFSVEHQRWLKKKRRKERRRLVVAVSCNAEPYRCHNCGGPHGESSCP